MAPPSPTSGRINVASAKPQPVPSASCCCLCVCPSQETVAIIETCGKFTRVAQPGCSCAPCCCGQSVVGQVSLRVLQLDVRCESKTLDNVFVTLVVSVQYQVEREKVYDAYYKLTDPHRQISSYVFDVVRSSVPRMNLDDVFVEKESIAESIKETLRKDIAGYGYRILHALVTDIEPALKVKEAMNEINAARRLRVAALEKAEASKVSVVKAAEGDAEAKFLQGQGIARQRQAIMSGLRDSVAEFSEAVTDVDSKDVLQLMLITQYFDMLRDVGGHSRNTTVFLPHAPAALHDIATQVRGAFLEASAGMPEHQK